MVGNVLTSSAADPFQTLMQYAEDIALALMCNKQRYQLALDNLESISDELHTQRRLVLPPRTPGVGAEAVDDLSTWPSVNIGECSYVQVLSNLWLPAKYARIIYYTYTVRAR